MAEYAKNTTVSSEASRLEIERTLRRYGADGFMYGTDRDKAVILFRVDGRHVKFVLTLPDREADDFCTYMRGSTLYQREPSAAEKLYEQAIRQKWRALALVIKAKLEAIDAGISVFEDEFMANIVMPDGQLFGAVARPAIAQAYQIGKMPDLLALAGPAQ